MALWALWTPIFAAGAIRSNLSPALIVQPNLFGLFATICFVQIWYWGKVEKGQKVNGSVGVAVTVGGLVVLGALEVATFFLLRFLDSSENESVQKFSTVVVLVATVLIIAGFFPQFHSIYKDKTCYGISRLFLLFDILGGLFSIIALIFHPPPFDTISSLSYAAVVFLDIVIYILGQFVYGWNEVTKPAEDVPSIGMVELSTVEGKPTDDDGNSIAGGVEVRGSGSARKETEHGKEHGKDYDGLSGGDGKKKVDWVTIETLLTP
ncbi:hypothetical protein HDU97_004443 [Phlyctochytrium planicorne]|nr:hypothetical protein HDU97_004443 [Phlyctochytrium planicorne]